jgi:signal transduction histidine kinase
MRERVESLGGEMKVTARTGVGVGIDISIPVDNPPQRPVAAP